MPNNFLRKKAEEKQSSAAIIISVDGKGQFFWWSWNYHGSHLNKDINMRI